MKSKLQGSHQTVDSNADIIKDIEEKQENSQENENEILF